MIYFKAGSGPGTRRPPVEVGSTPRQAADNLLDFNVSKCEYLVRRSTSELNCCVRTFGYLQSQEHQPRSSPLTKHLLDVRSILLLQRTLITYHYCGIESLAIVEGTTENGPTTLFRHGGVVFKRRKSGERLCLPVVHEWLG